jgi:hypothetical protein
VSFSAWPSCHARNQAGTSTTYSTTDSSYTQHNSGSPIQYGDFSAPIVPGQTLHGPCYGVFSSAIAHIRGASDSFDVNHQAQARQICLPK